MSDEGVEWCASHMQDESPAERRLKAKQEGRSRYRTYPRGPPRVPEQ